jgi:glucosamine--fructose-6-phosphate aminotransferase (isomerizing)
VVVAAALLDAPGPLLDGLARVPDEAARLLESSAGAVDALAEQLAGVSALVFAGRGYTLATALELALKAQETCGLPCVGLSAADLQHGPSAVLGPSVPLVLVAPPSGPALESLSAVAAEARRRSAPVVAIGGAPDLPEPLSPIAGVIPGQLLVEALARRLGVDPDHPAGLAKVTQTV